MGIGERFRLVRQAFQFGYGGNARTGVQTLGLTAGLSSEREQRNRGYRRNFTATAEIAYANPWSYRCIREISETLAGIPWQAVGANGQPVEMGREWRLLNQPSAGVTMHGWVERWATYLLIAGEVHAQIIANDRREILALDLLEPARIVRRLDVGANGEVEYDYRMRNGNMVSLDREMLATWMIADPIDDRYGHGPAAVAGATASSDESARELSESMVTRGVRPFGVIEQSPDSTMSVRDVEQLNQVASEMSSGSLAGSVLPLPKGASYVEVGLSPRDMDWSNLRTLNASEIAAVFGIAPELIGARESKYSNWQQAREALHVDTIQPLIQRLQNGLAMAVEPYWRGIKPEPDTSSVPALQGFYSRRVETARELIQLGWPVNAVNERLDLGLPELKGGDTEREPLGMNTDGEMA